jgi:hypothetical protein
VLTDSRYLVEVLRRERAEIKQRQLHDSLQRAAGLVKTPEQILHLALLLEYARRRMYQYSNRQVLETALARAVTTRQPLLVYLPRCLRYYYPDGDQQIIDHMGDEHYVDLLGGKHTKNGEDLQSELLADLHIALELAQLGVPVEIAIPLMDTELRRPETMNTQANYQRAAIYLAALQQFYQQICAIYQVSISVFSALAYFGDPSGSPLFSEAVRAMRYTQQNQFGISNAEYEHQINLVAERNGQDLSRIPEYRSREFARQLVEFETGDGVVLAQKMSEFDPNFYAGALVQTPPGSQFLGRVYATASGLVVYSQI